MRLPARRHNGVLRLNQKEFEEAMHYVATQDLPRVAKEVVSYISYATYSGIVERTPVLTGRARENWQVTMGDPSTKVIDKNQKVNTPGHWFPATGVPMTGKEKGKILPAIARIMAQPLGTRLWITNNATYISWLEDGTSAKAPGGMVEVTINAVLDGVEVQMLNYQMRAG